MDFVSLHNHSIYSSMDGLNTPEQMVNKLKEYNQTSFALSDHGNANGHIDFYRTLMSNDLKPILGSEVYFTEDSTERNGKDTAHLLLLAYNNVGLHNLYKILSESNSESSYYYTPRVDYNMLRKYNNGIVATSACMGGILAKHLMNNNEEKAIETLLEFKNIFGNRFFTEMQYHRMDFKALGGKLGASPYSTDADLFMHILDISIKNKVNWIFTNDSHIPSPEYQKAHTAIRASMFKTTIDQMSEPAYGEWMMSAEELYSLLKEVYPEKIIDIGFKNTVKIANNVNISIHNDETLFPLYDTNGRNKDELLREISYEGAYKIYGKELPKDVVDRLEEELNTISFMGFSMYFLVLSDLVHNSGANIGIGRGSAAGSIVAYCTGITKVDPLRYGLLFERFLSLGRIKLTTNQFNELL